MKAGLLIFALLAAAQPAAALPQSPHAVRVIGHRGAMGHAPENTLAAFKKALEQGADMVELDIHRSRDGKLVVMHDASAKRTTGVPNMVMLMSSRQLTQLDAGGWYHRAFEGEPVPLLEDVLTWAKGKIQVNIEVKAAGCEKEIVRLLQAMDLHNETIVTAFDHSVLRTLKKLDPKVRTGALISDMMQGLDTVRTIAKTVNPDAINPAKKLVTPQFVKLAHDLGMAVNVYTVNDPAEMKALITQGVDGIITNYPDRLLTVLSENR